MKIPVIAAIVVAAFMHAPSGAHAEADKYDVYAVRFATIAGFPVSSLIAGADRSRRLDIAMTVWVLKGADGRVALVDSGFHRDRYFTQFAVKDFVMPNEALATLGLKAADVTDIFLSHMHWDHAGGIDLFPTARVWLQKEEYEYYTGAAWQARNTHGGIDPDDVLELVKRNIAGRDASRRGGRGVDFRHCLPCRRQAYLAIAIRFGADAKRPHGGARVGQRLSL